MPLDNVIFPRLRGIPLVFSFLAVCLLCIAILPTVQVSIEPRLPLQDPPPVEFVEDVLQPQNLGYCRPSGQIMDTCCDFQSVESVQGDTYSKIQGLVKTKFFRYYKLNLWRQCPFWNDDGLCINRDCSVETADESLLPEEWRQEALSAIQQSDQEMFQPFKICTYKDQDFCLLEDYLDKDVVYVDLLRNPERFTGYAGTSANRVWKAIYEENCFDIVDKMTEGCESCNNVNRLNGKPSTLTSHQEESFAVVPNNKAELDQLLHDLAEQPDGGGGEEVCLEKRVYYRLISGLHSSISIHICDGWFDHKTGKWIASLDCFVNRIGSHPERLQNIYFTYALVLRSIAKLGDFFDHYNFATGDAKHDHQIQSMVHELIESASSCPMTFNEKTMFQGPDARRLYTEFRDHFRNVSRIMDCVGCEKCRLWGKLQTTGLGTALKVLFNYEEGTSLPPDFITRGEIVALFNSFNRLSESLQSIQMFRNMYHERMVGAIDKTLLAKLLSHARRISRYLYTQVLLSQRSACLTMVLWLKKWNIPLPNYLESLLLHT